MKFATLFSLAATILAAMALIGVGTASADSACLVDPDGGSQGECPGEKVWEGPIIGLEPEALFIIGGVHTTCESEFLADYIKDEGPKEGLLYLILDLTFDNCEGGCKTAVAENLPYSLLLLLWEQEHGYLTEDKKGRPAFLLEGCTVLKLNCLYQPPEKTLVHYVLEEDEEEPLVAATNIQLTRGKDSELCPKDAIFEGTYLIYEDDEEEEGGELFFTAI